MHYIRHSVLLRGTFRNWLELSLKGILHFWLCFAARAVREGQAWWHPAFWVSPSRAHPMPANKGWKGWTLSCGGPLSLDASHLHEADVGCFLDQRSDFTTLSFLQISYPAVPWFLVFSMLSWIRPNNSEHLSKYRLDFFILYWITCKTEVSCANM